MKDPKVLVFDVETSPLIAYVWGRHDVQVGLNQIKAEWSVIAWSAKWLGDPASKTMYRDQRNAKDIGNDREILLPLWELLNEADIVITQNGKNFDSKVLNARFIAHGMPPPSPYRHLDTYQIARGVAKFTSNKLEYLTEKLCTKYKKLSHSKFPGMSLWVQCLAGNKTAWNEMKRYNIHDVLSTEELYMKLRAWAPKQSPALHPSDHPTQKCRTCGSTEFMVRRGVAMTSRGEMQRYQCTGCGSWTQGGKVKGD